MEFPTFFRSEKNDFVEARKAWWRLFQGVYGVYRAQRPSRHVSYLRTSCLNQESPLPHGWPLWSKHLCNEKRGTTTVPGISVVGRIPRQEAQKVPAILAKLCHLQSIWRRRACPPLHQWWTHLAACMLAAPVDLPMLQPTPPFQTLSVVKFFCNAGQVQPDVSVNWALIQIETPAKAIY